MTNQFRCVNLVVQLPDKRLLLHKYTYDAQWHITIERRIKTTEAPLDCINDILWNLFGIDPFNYNDAFAEIKRYPPTKSMQDKNIIMYIAKLKSSISFQAGSKDQFQAIPWRILLNDVMENSVYTNSPKHTANAIAILQELHIKEVF